MRKVNMVLFAEPGVGKSVFASKFPKPFFICTDGNYEWLEDFGADTNAHKDITSFAEFQSLVDNPNGTFDNHETVVVDLVEDLFKWCEQEYCSRHNLDHVADAGYGKGYDITRTIFTNYIFKLFALRQSVILLSHSNVLTVKDRRGIEQTIYAPSTRIPDKVWDGIEGRVRYFLRAYLKAEADESGELIKKRCISFIPKENERFAIARGVVEKTTPQDIPLEWTDFVKWANLDNKPSEAHISPVVNETNKVKEVVENDNKSDKIAEIKAKLNKK